MSKKYTHLFFDLDNTLWDYDVNSYNALKIVLEKHKLINKISDYSKFYSIYHLVNEQLWVLFRENKINKREMREGRFEKTFMVYGTPMPGIGETINESYLKEMPLQLKLVDGAQEVLDYVYGKYKISIITNGFVESQISKIEQSGIKKYFDNVFISESLGVQKPDSLIFEHAIHSFRAPKKSTLMIGDSWETDIIGAMRMGIDQIFYQPSLLSFFADAKIVEFEPGMIEGYFEPSKESYSSHKNSTRLIFNLKQLIEIL